ncbi:MAG: HD domain-containing protein [Coriobacteriales bacterium]|nr:HD domain-containing protein [Coriobacteriales bacterium]
MADKNLDMARKVAAAVAEAGGQTFFVGGYVRDLLLGRENKDVDIEVHGISVDQLEHILDNLGERLTMGESFGIMGLRHYELDIAMPRSEVATGRGHRDFAVFVDPFIGTQKAARRRDFTINALMQDVLTGEVLDFFGGREDLERHTIRHVDPQTFVEDPLRVLRAAQFAARFDFVVADETCELSATMDLSALSRERIMGELEKALLKAQRPSTFFAELRRMSQLSEWFGEVEALMALEQDPQHHPEGTVWDHTMMVLDYAATLRDQTSEPLGFMLAALCHDFGKAVTTEVINGRIHAYGHEIAGLPIVRAFLNRLTSEKRLAKYVLNMVELHMRPNHLVADGARVKSHMKTFDASVCPEDLVLLAKADHFGRTFANPEQDAKDYEAVEERLRQMLEEYHRRMDAPHVTGQDLIDAGLEPGPAMGEVLAYVHKVRLAGRSKDEQLRQALGYARTLH